MGLSSAVLQSWLLDAVLDTLPTCTALLLCAADSSSWPLPLHSHPLPCRLHSEHALVEELQRRLCERELVLVTEVQGRRGACAGDASPDGIDDRRHDGKHVPKTWVPRVYTAPADSLVRLATGLSWLGIRCALCTMRGRCLHRQRGEH